MTDPNATSFAFAGPRGCEKRVISRRIRFNDNDEAIRDVQENACEAWRTICQSHCNDD